MKKLIMFSLFSVCISTVCIAGMWGHRPQSYGDVKLRFANVFVLKVDSIRTRETLKHYANGKSTLSQETILIDGTIQRKVRGNMKKEKVRLIFVSKPPVLYDSNGKMTLGTLIQSNRSGLELKVKIGESYIFSLESLRERENRYLFTRVDELGDEDKITTILAGYEDKDSPKDE